MLTKNDKEYIWSERRCNFTSSLITLDQLNVQKSIETLIDNYIPMLHIDIVDGVFSPEFPLGLKLVEEVVKKFKDEIFLDCHIMSNQPDWFVEKLIDFGVDHINFHYETAKHVDGLLNRIKSKCIKAGVALKPSTPLYELEYIIEKCDSVLIMLFNPGYSFDKNEKQIEYTYKKVDDLVNMIKRRGAKTKIFIDGRISKDNIDRWGYSSIVTGYVLGSTCVNKNDLDNSLKEMNDFRNTLLGI